MIVRKIQTEIYDFWKSEGDKHIQPGVSIFHEGWDARLFLRELFTENEYGTVIDVGCGYGRLAPAFNPENYYGIDFCPSNILKAKINYPDYNFKLTDNISYEVSDTKILFYVLLHQSDKDINNIVHNLCISTERIIVAEVCGREWRRPDNPPVFNRNVEEYLQLFADNGKDSVNIINKDYIPYMKTHPDKNTQVNIMVFE
jgi:SAM-dependent methyltransferase